MLEFLAGQYSLNFSCGCAHLLHTTDREISSLDYAMDYLLELYSSMGYVHTYENRHRPQQQICMFVSMGDDIPPCSWRCLFCATIRFVSDQCRRTRFRALSWRRGPVRHFSSVLIARVSIFLTSKISQCLEEHNARHKNCNNKSDQVGPFTRVRQRLECTQAGRGRAFPELGVSVCTRPTISGTTSGGGG